MCSQMDAEPGPPLKANVSGRLARVLAVERVGDVEHFRFDLAVAALDGQASGGGCVLQQFAVDGDLVMASPPAATSVMS